MPFITINISPDMKRTAKALSRIAHVLERIAIDHLGLELKPVPQPDERDKSVVSYTDDKVEVRKELEKAMGLESESEPENV